MPFWHPWFDSVTSAALVPEQRWGGSWPCAGAAHGGRPTVGHPLLNRAINGTNGAAQPLPCSRAGNGCIFWKGSYPEVQKARSDEWHWVFVELGWKGWWDNRHRQFQLALGSHLPMEGCRQVPHSPVCCGRAQETRQRQKKKCKPLGCCHSLIQQPVARQLRNATGESSTDIAHPRQTDRLCLWHPVRAWVGGENKSHNFSTGLGWRENNS